MIKYSPLLSSLALLSLCPCGLSVRAQQATDLGIQSALPSGYQCQDVRVKISLENQQPSSQLTLNSCANISVNLDSIPDSDSFNLDLGVKKIVKETPGVESFQQKVQSSEYQLKSAQGSWWPSISMSNSSILFTDIQAGQNYGGSPSAPSSPATSGTAFNPFNGSQSRDGGIFARLKDLRESGGSGGSGLNPWTQSYSTYTQAYPVIQLQWNFLDPTRYPQIAAARKQLELAKSALSNAKRQDFFEIKKSLIQYQLAGMGVSEAAKLLKLQEQILSDTMIKTDARMVPRLSINQAYADILSYQRQLKQSLLQQENALIQLRAHLQTQPHSEKSDEASAELMIKLLQTEFPFELKQWPFDPVETHRLAEHYSEQLIQAKLQVGIDRDNANAQWGAILPTVGILAYSTYQYTWGSQNYAPPGQPNGAQSGSLSNYAGLSFSWNIFDGWATRNQALAYERMAASDQLNYDNLKIQLKARVDSLLNQLRVGAEFVDLALRDLANTSKIYSDLSARRGAGLQTLQDVLSAKIGVAQSQAQVIRAIAAYQQSYEELAYLCNLADGPGYAAGPELASK